MFAIWTALARYLKEVKSKQRKADGHHKNECQITSKSKRALKKKSILLVLAWDNQNMRMNNPSNPSMPLLLHIPSLIMT